MIESSLISFSQVNFRFFLLYFHIYYKIEYIFNKNFIRYTIFYK